MENNKPIIAILLGDPSGIGPELISKLLINQEVEKVIPEVIETSRGFINTDNDKERKTIAYPKLVPYLVDTIQELTKRNRVN